ncbi:MAG: transpeptidase family protein [Prevotellaceae bacterium]|nr:transpeptidase family protein [Prevotellaceae bacterium]
MKKIILRFGVIYVLIIVVFVIVVYKMIAIQTDRHNWLAISPEARIQHVELKAKRGNIYSEDGRLMSSSIPTYYLKMDLRVEALWENNGQLFKDNIDSVSIYLARFFKDKSAGQYKHDITKAYLRKSGQYLLYPHKVSYSQLKELRTFPLFKLGRIKSGLIPEVRVSRVKPFNSLASRTIGNVYGDMSKGGESGLEKYFDTELTGKPGVSVFQKIANMQQENVVVEPEAGMDLITTLNIDMQDIAEKTLVDSLRAFNAHSGYVILMEVRTGEVKAIVNMQRNGDGGYSERKNGAVSDMAEPGSTFKVVSLLAVLDDGKAKLTDSINTGNGLYTYGKQTMKDHNAHRGGYGKISVANTIHASSNVGLSRVVVNAYGSNPSAFVDKLYAMGLNKHMNLEIPGTATPNIKHPKDEKANWSKTSLPWMSIGYEVQIPPIYTLAFYNAIANDGKLIRPFFVKEISKNGQTVKQFETEVINPAICKPTTVRDMQEVLLGVVEGKLGTARMVRSDKVRIAGKTGTAQISKGALGYSTGGKTHQVSFCGYFPADNPKYSCIVVIREPKNGYPSGGRMSGMIFKDIAERVMALNTDVKPQDIVSNDTLNHYKNQPVPKSGNYKALYTVAKKLDQKMMGEASDWVKTALAENEDIITINSLKIEDDTVPDVIGMGAKDAVYLLEKAGLRVQLNGIGKVTAQSIKPNTKVQKGRTILLALN